MLKIASPAKINLFLYVTARRANGYHDLCTLMSCVTLYDEIELAFNQTETTVSCDNPDIPHDESNLAFKAVNLFNETLLSVKRPGLSTLATLTDGITPSGVRIHIKKKIPVGAGLGGGSSNAAGVLKAMNRFYGFPFSDFQLMKMGLALGADVPFFILGGSALARGVGEKVRQLPSLEQHHILLFYPGLEASTADVYKNLDLGLTKSVKSNNKCLLKTSEITKGFDIIRGLMHNDLELSACTLYPEIGLFRKELVDCLPETVMMTGSGSTFFSLFSDYEKAQRCFDELSTKWRFTRREIFLVSFVNAASVI